MDGNNTTSTATTPPTKGFGLKKWRRIPRDSSKDAPSSSADSGKAVVLKRLLPSASASAAAAESDSSSTAASAPPKPKPKPKLNPPATKGGKKHKDNSNSNANGDDAATAAANGHRDPLLHSLLNLRSLHDALAKEVEMLGEMATQPPVLCIDGVDEARVSAEVEDSDLDALFKQRMAAEIEYLAIVGATQSLKIVAAKQVSLFQELDSAAHEQAEVLARLEKTENKAAKLKKEVEEGQFRIPEEEVVYKVARRSVCKVTLCFFTQLMLLLLVLWSFVSDPGEVVVPPT